MNSKRVLLLVLSLIIATVLMFSVSAATTINPTLPAVNFTNISGATYSLNVTILGGGAAGNTTGNVTFYYKPWSYAGNATWIEIATVNNDSESQWYFNTTWDTTALVDGKNYTLNFTANQYPGVAVNATNVSANMTIDNTAPTILVYSGATLTAYANGTSIKTNNTLTGSLFPNNITLNVSVSDATIGIANVSDAYCFINVNGGLNHSVPLLANAWCNSSDINITDLSDGNNTINIYVNDTIQNLLNTTLVVQVDTTAPTSTTSCSPTTVQAGDTFPCSCSGTDATSGVDSSTGSSTSNSITSTANTGTFTYTCTVTDNGGLSTSSTGVYSVTQTPNTGGAGSSSSTTTWITHSVSESILEQGYTRELAANNRVKVKINSEDHFIGVNSISGSQATIEISSDPIQLLLSIGEEAKVDVDDDGFYDVYVLLKDISGNNAVLTMQKINEVVPQGSGSVDTTGQDVTQTPPTEEESKESSRWIWIVIGVVVILFFWMKSGKKRKK